MRFQKQTTFNSHDTKVIAGENGRIHLDQTRGVKARCELSLNALTRFVKGANSEEITDHLNSRLNANYTVGDIRRALNRLALNGIIRNNGGHYTASQASVTKWRKAVRP
jgi:hypothetical protein